MKAFLAALGITMAACVTAFCAPTDAPIESKLPAIIEIRTKTPEGVSSGTGFVIEPSGTAVTCFHVISHAQEVALKTTSGETYGDIRVLAFDVTRDLAIIKFAAFGSPIIPLADSDAIHVGDAVFAVGHPKGLENSVTKGIVSAIRTVDGVRVIQTDSAASPGSSGGPLLNEKGECIGVVSFKISGEGLNFALPSNYVRGLLGMQSAMTLEQFNAAASKKTADASMFTAGSGDTITGKWRSLDSNTIKVLRQDGDYVSGESFTRDEKQSLGSYDLRKQADGSYAGRIKGSWACRWWSVWAFPYPDWRENQCNTEDQVFFTKVDANRIEGYIYGPKAPPQNDRNFAAFCKTCGATFPKVKANFVWVRAE